MNNIQLTTLIVGLLHMPLALTVWAMLHRRTRTLPLRLWVGGGLVMGLGTTAMGLRDMVPVWVSYELAIGLLWTSLALRTVALRFDMQLPVRWPLLLTLWLAGMLAYSACVRSERWLGAMLVAGGLYTLGTAFFAREAWRAGLQQRSRSGRVLAIIEGLFVVTILLRLLLAALGISPVGAMKSTWDGYLVSVAGMAAAIYGNLGYLGLVLDRNSAAVRTAREAQLAETVRRETAEHTAEQLRALMAERAQLLHVLAHEIRQPLHNAGGALAAACEVLQAPQPGGAERATARLQRAQAVLDQMRSVLDNTLAATALMTHGGDVQTMDVELDTLVQVTLGDFAEAQRARITVLRCTDLRSHELEFNVVRLALRNLLRNALIHAGETAQVTLRIEESAQPPALVLAVCDDGPGLSAAQLAANAQQPTGRLGLTIVRQVMALHGGRLVLGPGSPRGLRAALEFPLPAADEAEAEAMHHQPSLPGAPLNGPARSSVIQPP